MLVCGRYEGVDQRAIELGIDEELSIGDYVLSGGELGALVIIDAVARFVPGVLGDAASVDEESFSAGLLEYPHYTRPATLGERAVPAILSSGNHAAIAAWRRAQAIARTAARRADLWERFAPTAADRAALPPPLHARTHLALVHHPVFDRTGKIVTSALTNFDIHDLARSTMTYGLAAYHVVTPITSQRDKAAHIARLWADETARANVGHPRRGARARPHRRFGRHRDRRADRRARPRAAGGRDLGPRRVVSGRRAPHDRTNARRGRARPGARADLARDRVGVGRQLDSVEVSRVLAPIDRRRRLESPVRAEQPEPSSLDLRLFGRTEAPA